MDYKACIMDKSLLKIEIVSENISIIKDIEQSIQTILDEKLGHKMNFVVTANPDSKPEKIINSMVKRKICDFRGAIT